MNPERSVLHKSVLHKAIALSLASLLGMPVAQAQQAAAPGEAERKSQSLDAISVTGSRIKTAEMVTNTPVIAISREQIDRSGLNNIGDILAQLNSAGSGLNTGLNKSGSDGTPADGGGTGAGSTQLNLRHLGAKRVLVLVDGVRWVNESSGSGVAGSVDMSTIPSSIIERIEILQDGASSLYGSDAIAGVVNVITRKSQDGASLNVYGADYTRQAGGAKNAFDLSAGGQGERLDWFASVGHSRQQEVRASSWWQSYYRIPYTGIATDSTTTPYTRLIFNSDTNFGNLCSARGAGYACNLVSNGTSSGDPGTDFHRYTTADRYNSSAPGLLLNPLERSSAFGQATWRFSDSVSGYAKALFNRRESENSVAPAPITGGSSSSGALSDVVISASNPYNPLGMDVVPSTLQFRPMTNGNRVYQQEVDTRYLAIGLQGVLTLGERDYYWDVNYADAENEAANHRYGLYNSLRIREALGADCSGDCVPLNLFGGPEGITQEMADYIGYSDVDRSQQRLRDFTANLSGSLFELPAGPLDFAAGYEHRRQSGYYRLGAAQLAVQQEVLAAGYTPSFVESFSGSFFSNEAYAEFNAPLLRDAFLAQDLSLSAAIRYSDYSNFGNTSNTRLGLRWQLNDSLTLRGTWSEGFRAPSIGEAYSRGSTAAPRIVDPCSNASGAVQATCASVFGVPEGYEQINTQLGVQTNGNPDLQPEESKNLSFGLVYSPGWAEGRAWSDKLDFNASFYRIRIDGAIQAANTQNRLNQCVADGDASSPYCQGIVRGAGGEITDYVITLENLGTIDTHGWDFGLTWTLPAWRWGQMKFDLQNSYLSKYEAIDNYGNLEPKKIGFSTYDDGGLPRLKSTADLSWKSPGRAWSANWRARYISRLDNNCGNAINFAVCDDPANNLDHMGGVTYHDVRLSWNWSDRDMLFALGINNLFDKQPPVCLAACRNGYDATVYSFPSRMVYASVRLDLW